MPKGPKIQKSDVIIECTPDTTVECNWEEVMKIIKDLELSGVQMGEPGLVDFVFGMKKCMVMCQIIDSMVPSTTVITEALAKIAGIDAATLVEIKSAGSDWAAEDKKDAAKAGGDGKSKKKKKKKKKEAAKVITEAEIKKAADKVVILVKEADYYVAGVPDMDLSGQINCTEEQLKACMALVRAKNTECAITLIAAGIDTVSCLVDVPESKSEGCDASVLLNKTMCKGEGSKTYAFGSMKCDPDADQFPIKIKDMVSADTFAALKKMGLLDDGSDDEIIALDDGEGY